MNREQFKIITTFQRLKYRMATSFLLGIILTYIVYTKAAAKRSITILELLQSGSYGFEFIFLLAVVCYVGLKFIDFIVFFANNSDIILKRF